MVKGRSLEDEMKRIDDFFEKLSMDEFEKLAIEAGIGRIKNSCESAYVKAQQLPLDATYSSKSIYNNKNLNSEWITDYSILQGAA